MKHILTILAAVLLSLGAMYLVSPSGAGGPAVKETAYERIVRTGTLRCGYWNWPPLLSVDSNTGKVSGGIFKDYTEALAESLSLKVEWVKEVGFATFATDLQLGGIDAICGGVWPLAAVGREMDFTTPLFYLPLHVYVREGDTRFEKDIKLLNSKNITFASMDGLVGSKVARKDFPLSREVSIPDIMPVSDIYQILVSGKADALINDVFTSQGFMDANPGSIRVVPTQQPLRFFGNTIGIPKGEYELKRLLDNATEQLLYSGVVDAIIDKYETYPGMLLRVAKPYKD